MTNYLKSGRSPGWIELLFDLAFVVLIGRTADMLFHTENGHYPFETIIIFIWIFFIQSLIWIFFTIYMNYYGNNFGKQNYFTFAIMICLFLNYIFMSDFQKNSKFIGLSLALITFLISNRYKISKNKIKENIKYAKFKRKSLLTLSILDWKLLIIYTTILYTGEYILNEIFTIKFTCAKPDVKHFVERIGIFITLVFGESFLTLIHIVDALDSTERIINFFLLLLTIFGLWINYFTFIEEIGEKHYERYNQILLNNVSITAAMILFSGIIHHGIYEELNIKDFEIVMSIFTITFFAASSISFSKIQKRKEVIIYGLMPLVIIIINNLLFDSYTMTLLALYLETLLTAFITIRRKSIYLKSKKQIKRKE